MNSTAESSEQKSVNVARTPENWYDTTSWDPYVPVITDTATYLRRKFRQDVTDKSTGLDQSEIHALLANIVAADEKEGLPWRITKAKCFAAQVRRMAIDVSPLDWFPAISVWNRLDMPIRRIIWSHAEKVNRERIPAGLREMWANGNQTGEWACWQDFDHSVPDWEEITAIGFSGMRERLAKFAAGGDPFYDFLTITADALEDGVRRFISQGRKRLEAEKDSKRLKKETEALENLLKGPPQTAYEMLLFIWIYFFFSEHLDGFQCRSLSAIDVLLTPYLRADLEAGRTDEAEFREQFTHFLWQWGSVCNYWNQPVCVGGTAPGGESAYNEISMLILDIADDYGQTTPKILAKVADNTPAPIMEKMLDMARRRRSIAFIGEAPIAAAAKKWLGATDEECRKLVLTGCYEWAIHDSVNRTTSGYINLLKPIEQMLSEAQASEYNPESFEALKADYFRRISDTINKCRELSVATESVLGDVNPSDLYTLSSGYALEKRRDGFFNGARNGNFTSILAIGLGTTVDALLAVKELVFEKRLFTLAELGGIMAADWQGHEKLRLQMLRSNRKWGNNDKEANELGREIGDLYASQINGRPNGRGGIFLASGHSARQFIELGKKTGATPDGRKAGEEMSKNLSPAMGADTEGATALVNTLSHLNSLQFPGDTPLDIMLHPSVCEGERGLALMKILVNIFHRNGGSVVQFTTFSAEELRDAQAHPEKYETLQVRVCGWNVRWNDMCKSEQDKYIERAETTFR